LSLLLALPVQVGEQMKRMPGGSGSNPFAQMVEDADGLDKIEALQVGKDKEDMSYVWAVYGEQAHDKGCTLRGERNATDVALTWLQGALPPWLIRMLSTTSFCVALLAYLAFIKDMPV
jgi:hypothetical protein